MKAAEFNKQLSGKDGAALVEQLAELRREQFNLRMQGATGQLTQNHRIREVRRNIARVKTAMQSKAAN